ncbi:secretion protein HlyD family protein [Planctopirus limnophila DSM 3776]|uniref:Secretion protein HlyD family protein n=1 Tax=Planctopirus limnophila (strain ATCC 43296 / DSM 3776 / IFAM 1008 / Mu 290) TaxID=521674 RepID=D5STW5_PLAL2|nr:HlyD family efflux transporter periplasmic adaptor subunit [Planctopirus limnophila]ADG66950.1 secretion protein HlyD family protein [Planctopirus limnophila DSM 3776]
MLIRFGTPLLAALAMGFGIATLTHLTPKEQLTPAPNPPTSSTISESTISGLGEVQMAGEPIAIATPLSGIVTRVHVVTGQSVRAGDPLFTLDDRALTGELNFRKATLATAQAKLGKLEAGTRPEDFPSSRAKVEAMTALFKRSEDAWNRAKLLIDKRALSEEEQNARRYLYEQSAAELSQAKADLAKLEAGTWKHDLEIAQREVEAAAASLAMIQIDLDRLVIRAPVDGLVLHADVRPGEFAEAGNRDKPLIQLGQHGPLRVRVQIDEEDAIRVKANSKAEAFVRGRDRTAVKLQFVRIDPRIVPKSSLTGGTTERVDTRVLFVVYEVVENPTRIYAGQKLDVFMEG